MKRATGVGIVLLVALVTAFAVTNPDPSPPAAPTPADSAAAPEAAAVAVYDESGFRLGEEGLSPSARAGREIWYKATAGNARFHTYTMQQRIGVFVDWYRVLNATERDDRFRAWGLIHDPSCCMPGSDNCPAKSLEETYGLEWCPGDDVLLKHVGKEGYRDPACDFKDAPLAADETHGPKDQRQSPCDLAFGTSTGALGLRKFPNPRFNAEQWKKLNGGMASWEGYRKVLSTDSSQSDFKVSHIRDGAIEPPFTVGMACGACHIAFDPLKPPADPARPKWENIKGGIGNQYLRMSEILGSAMPLDSIEWQVFAHARPGTTDTSAIPTDQVNNPGTINALINIAERPTFADEKVVKWRKVKACAQGEADGACWCEPGRDGKCWQHGEKTGENIHHILKGGEDSIGALEAIQRVYFNIGSCAEACWVNHLTDMRQLDPQQRNFGQTPFNIGQCRRDCPNFRAIEDRLHNILDFFVSRETNATDLNVARENALKASSPNAKYGYEELVADLDKNFGKGAVARGRTLFAENCARCHSSIPEDKGGPFKNRSFREMDEKTGLRADWLGNDRPTKVTEVGTYRCRALHSNHMAGHVYQEYGSETTRARPPDPNLTEPADGGRGYYRNISLLSLWAHAPFMHNNAIGPELCGQPANKDNDFDRERYVDDQGVPLPKDKQPACWSYDPSVEGRFKLYVESMNQLLNPKQRIPKVTKFNQPVTLEFGPKLWDGQEEKQMFGFMLTIPAGTTVGALGNFQHKRFMDDLFLARAKPAELNARLAKQYGEADGKKFAAELSALAGEILKEPGKLIEAAKQHPELLRTYSTCVADDPKNLENAGHAFGEDLSDADKKALIAFLATM